MRHYHFYHAHRATLHFSDFWRYELSMWMHTLAHALIGIFVPILLLRSGYDLRSVILYYFLLNCIDVPLNWFARVIITKIGARFTIAIATVVCVSFLWILLRLENPLMSTLVLLAALAALYDTLYWVAHFFLFIESGGAKKHAGESMGIMYAVREGAVILGPAIGAAILLLMSRGWLLASTVTLFLLSLVPLAFVRKLPDFPRRQALSYGTFFKSRLGKRAYLASALYAMHGEAESTLFPLFIYLIFESLQSVAIIPVLVSLASMIIALTIGKIQPRRRALALVFGSLLIAGVWCIRIYFDAPTIYYASILFVSICVYFVLVPIDSAIFEYALLVQDPLSASMYRNVAYMFTCAILYGILMITLNVAKPTFVLAISCLLLLAIIHMTFPALSKKSRL